MVEINRCGWCNNDKLYQAYHDSEWGVPCRDDKKLFEFLILEGAQAGLSWITILKRREQYRQAFCGFQVDRVAEFTTEDVARLMGNKGIIRNRLKIESAISNARCYQKVQSEYSSFSKYIWAFVGDTPIVNHWTSQKEIPVTTEISNRMRLWWKWHSTTRASETTGRNTTHQITRQRSRRTRRRWRSG